MQSLSGKYIIILLLIVVYQVNAACKTLIIGDSLSVGAKKYFEQYNIKVNAKTGRQFQALKYIAPTVSGMDIVIIELGTNGDFSLEKAQKDIDLLLAKNKSVYVVTVRTKRPWQDVVNKKLRSLRGVKIIDWYSYSKDKPDLFLQDGTHLTEKGYLVYAEFIFSKSNQNLIKESVEEKNGIY